MEGDFDLSGFGNLAQYSLSNPNVSEGPAFGGNYDLGPAASSGFDFQAPQQAEPSAFSNLATAAKDFLYTPAQKGQPAGGLLGGVGQVAGAALPLASLGVAGMGIASQIGAQRQAAEQGRLQRRALGLQEQAAAQTSAAAAPLAEFGRRQLETAEAGNIPPAIQAQIDTWKQGAMQQANDYAARSGQGDSTMLRHWMDWIEQQAQAMQAGYLQDTKRLGITGLSQGAQASNAAGSGFGQVGQQAQQQGASVEQLIAHANQALNALSAGAA